MKHTDFTYSMRYTVVIYLLSATCLFSGDSLFLVQSQFIPDNAIKWSEQALSGSVTINQLSIRSISRNESPHVVDLSVNLIAPDNLDFFAALLFNPNFKVLIFTTIDSSGKASINSKGDWVLLYGKGLPEEIDMTTVINNTLLDIGSGAMAQALEAVVSKTASSMQVNQDRIPNIVQTFERLAVRQVLSYAKRYKLDISNALSVVSSRKKLFDDPELLNLYLSMTNLDLLPARFDDLLAQLNKANKNSVLYFGLRRQLTATIGSAKTKEEVAYFGSKLENSDSSSLQQDFLRMASQFPSESTFSVCLKLARSPDDLVAYHAIKALNKYKLPQKLGVPTIEEFKSNPTFYREKWFELLGTLLNTNPSSIHFPGIQ